MNVLIQKLELLKNRLCTSNKGNLIRQLKVHERQKFFDLYRLNTINEEYSGNTNEIIKNIISLNSSSLLLHENEQNDEVINYSAKFNKLHKEFKKLVRTKGKRDLYIGYPFLEGYIKKGAKEEYIRAPIFLIPCELIKNQDQGVKWQINSIYSEEDIINYNLLKYLAAYSHINIDENVIKNIKKLPEENFVKWLIDILKDLNINVSHINEIEICEEYLKNNYIEINKFKDYKADEVPKLEEFKSINIFKIKGHCVLGIYSKSSSAILNDYTTLLDRVNSGDDLGLASELLAYLNENDEVDIDNIDIDEVKEDEKYYITKLDASQEEAVLQVENSKGVVVHGPPGTGKSQVITSMISNSLAKGRKILMVCEKETAIKVIYDRLNNAGLSKYAAHIDDLDVASKKKELFHSIRDIMKVLENKELSVDLRCKLRNINEKIDEKTSYLNSIARTLHTKLIGNTTPYKLYNNIKSTSEDSEIFLGDVSARFTEDKLEEIKPKLTKLAEYYYKINYDNILKYRISFSDFEISHRREIINRIDKIIKEYVSIKENDFFKKVIKLQNQCNMHIEEMKNLIDNIYKIIRSDKIGLIYKIKRYFWLKFNGKIVLNKMNISETNDLEKLSELIKEYTIGLNKLEDILKFIEDLKIFLNKQGIDEIKNRLCKSEEFHKEVEVVKDIIFNDFEKINDHDRIIESLSDDEKYIYDKLKEKDFQRGNDMGIKWYNAVKKSLYEDWIYKIERDYPLLKDASAECDKYNSIVESYKAKIKEKDVLIPKIIELKLMEIMKESEEKCGGKLWKEVSKKSRFCSVRELIKKYIHKGLLNYKPLWLVSPDVAASIFPLEKGLFDLIIFDEASQLKVEDTIPLIYRAKKLVVAGDEKQLPPSGFGNSEENEEFDNVQKDEEVEQLLSYRSLLDLCNNVFHRDEKLLSWHYRSEYEELINFSNHAFYKGEIQISPNVLRGSENKAIEWIKVEKKTVYENGKNEVEAEVLCDVLHKVFEEYEGKSVGIIAFTKKQQECIEKVIEKRCRENIKFKNMYDKADNHEDPEKRIFISNIDEIQGDERQIIIFSVGYAPRQDGKFNGSITGNLNKKEGQYRLNVAISRAQSKIFVISSIEPTIMKEANAENSKGRWLFKEYLEYCKAVYNNDKLQVESILKRINKNTQRSNTEDDFDSPFEIEVVSKLRDRGYTVETQIGCSGYKIDMGIVHPNNPNIYILGIEADGATYHSARSAKERDIYRQKFLEMKGWKIERIWSRDWWINSDREINRIEKKIKEILTEEQL